MPCSRILKHLINALLIVLFTGMAATSVLAQKKAPAASGSVPERVTGIALVLDGYTVEIGKQRIRLSGVSAPEMKEARGQ